MSKFKDKFKMGLGAVVASILGATALYWSLAFYDYGKLTEVFEKDLDNMVFTADTGQPGSVRDKVISIINKLKPTKLILGGDTSYPTGTTSMELFKRDIVPFMAPEREVDVIGSNHQVYDLKKKQRDWLAENADRLGVKFKNYYRGEAYKNICLGYVDSSPYDVLVGKPKIIADQEKYIRKFFNSDNCLGKPKYLIAHHTVYTYGPHAKDTKKAWQEFVESLEIDGLISGHDHLLAYTHVNGKHYYVVGPGSKLSECLKDTRMGTCLSAPGVLLLKNNTFTFKMD